MAGMKMFAQMCDDYATIHNPMKIVGDFTQLEH